jgi:hypothetical protein
MTRRIGSLHLPACRLAAAATQELGPPSRAPDSRLSPRGLRRQRGDPPPGYRRIRQNALARRLSSVAPAPQQEGGDAGALCGELQPAARHRGESSDFTDHRGDAGSAQAFLHRPQDLGVARRPDQHEMLGIEPVGGKAGPVEIQAGKTPQDHAVSGCYETPKDNSYESGDECAILLG